MKQIETTQKSTLAEEAAALRDVMDHIPTDSKIKDRAHSAALRALAARIYKADTSPPTRRSP